MKETYFDNQRKSSCNGCGTCKLLCPVQAITMQEDVEGFLYPVIDKNKCIKCGKCKRVCSNFNDKKEENEKAYVAINHSKQQLEKSSSGGMFYILAEYVFQNEGVVCGVMYNENLEVVHEFATSLEQAKKFCGSKYVRSNLQNTYQQTKQYLEEDKYVLFTGTACQISGLKSFLGKEYEKLILCDILCHGNPSPKVFKMYVKNLEENKKEKVRAVHFRSKENGWKNSTPIIVFENGEKLEDKSYYNAFIEEIMQRPSCHECPFASKRRISDFTIADFWGIEKVVPKLECSEGVSLITVNSNKGSRIFEEIKKKMNYQEVDYDTAASYNHYHNVEMNKKRKQFFESINEKNIIDYMKQYTKKPIYKKIGRKLKNILHKIKWRG